MGRPNPSRPRRPSPPPTGARSRGPPSPGLLARALPSTATLNALPTLSRAPSQLQLVPANVPLVQASPVEFKGEWIVVPHTTSERSTDVVKRILGLNSAPEFKDVVLDYPVIEYIFSSLSFKVGTLWTLRPCTGSKIASGRFELDRAFRLQNPGDKEKLLEYYSQTYNSVCEIQDCVFVWETARGNTIQERLAEGFGGKIIVASWPLRRP